MAMFSSFACISIELKAFSKSTKVKDTCMLYSFDPFSKSCCLICLLLSSPTAYARLEAIPLVDNFVTCYNLVCYIAVWLWYSNRPEYFILLGIYSSVMCAPIFYFFVPFFDGLHYNSVLVWGCICFHLIVSFIYLAFLNTSKIFWINIYDCYSFMW